MQITAHKRLHLNVIRPDINGDCQWNRHLGQIITPNHHSKKTSHTSFIRKGLYITGKMSIVDVRCSSRSAISQRNKVGLGGMLCNRLVRLKIYPTLHTEWYNGSGGPDSVIKNGKSTTSINQDSHSYLNLIPYR